MRALLLRTLLLLAVVLAAVAAWFGWHYQQFLHTPLAIPADGVSVEVSRGTGLRQVSDDLAVRGLLASPELLVLYGRLNGLDTGIKAGEYLLEPGLTPPALLAQISSGRVVQYALTLVEGWTFHQALAAVRADPVLRRTLDPEADDDALMAALGRPGLHPEGRLFPSTYHFPRGTSDVEFLRRALEQMEQVLQQAWAQRAEGLPFADPYEALVLASIVEKESALAEERPLIAGVFVRRLERGMRLQADPTVIYGLGSGFDGDLRRRDLRTDGPYNSYTRHGLPPTPIALPGAGSIEAVLHPAAGQALYFVARGDGSHEFSATLAEHSAAVRRYQLGGKDKR
ncbi:MAG TPA: endolytic transglycosylase MltG [Gammaproteobacteria bacterium]